MPNTGRGEATGIPTPDTGINLNDILSKIHQSPSATPQTNIGNQDKNTGKISSGTKYHFFEGKKNDQHGHWQKTGYFYWQLVYYITDEDTGKRKRIRKGGKKFSSCPSEDRKQQFLQNTGRRVEHSTGRLIQTAKNTGKPAPKRMSISTDAIHG